MTQATYLCERFRCILTVDSCKKIRKKRELYRKRYNEFNGCAGCGGLDTSSGKEILLNMGATKENMEIGKKLKDLRLERGLSQRDLMNRGGFNLDYKTISKWETGENRIPDRARAKIAAFFGLKEFGGVSGDTVSMEESPEAARQKSVLENESDVIESNQDIIGGEMEQKEKMSVAEKPKSDSVILLKFSERDGRLFSEISSMADKDRRTVENEILHILDAVIAANTDEPSING